MRIVVVGAGVIGLSCAHRLRAAGHAVEVWSRDAPAAEQAMRDHLERIGNSVGDRAPPTNL